MSGLTDLEITAHRNGDGRAVYFRWNGARCFVWWDIAAGTPADGQPIRWPDIPGRRRNAPATTATASLRGRIIIDAVRAAITAETLDAMRAADQARRTQEAEDRRQAVRKAVAERHALPMLAILELIDGSLGVPTPEQYAAMRDTLASIRRDIKSAAIIAGDE